MRHCLSNALRRLYIWRPGAAPEGGSVRQVSDLPGDIRSLVAETEIVSGILQASSDCIKVIGLDGTLEFMSSGGQRVMEVEDVTRVVGCPWPSFWPGEGGTDAAKAVAAAASGQIYRFRGPAPTAKGSPRWWDVTVSPIFGADGKPLKILSVSRDITDQIEADRTRDLLMREMQHRVMNTLAMVSAIATQSLRSAKDLDAARISIAQRIEALGRTHHLLMTASRETTRVQTLILETTKPFDEQKSRFSVRGPDIMIGSRSALALALVINELCTNATKYGALSTGEGMVEIVWEADGGNGLFDLIWTETGGPAVVRPERTGFGSRLIEQSLNGHPGGRAVLDFAPDGVVCRLTVPVGESGEG